MIGTPLHSGSVSEVCPVAPRADVRAPLVMERLLQDSRDELTREEAAQVGVLGSSLGGKWQRLISSNFEGYDAQFVLQRFVGITVRDVCNALRTSGRVLPMAVLRAVANEILDGLSALEREPSPPNWPHHLTDRSIGLGVDRQWCFAIGGLNHWLANFRPTMVGGQPEYSEPLPPDVMFFLSPEAFQARTETPAAVATRASLFIWQLVAGHHPFRGTRYKMFESITRFARSEVRVPLEVHPDVTPALSDVLGKGVRFAGERFENVAELRGALDAAWPEPAASHDVVFQTLITVAWSALREELHLLRREPLLPIKWDGVWSASRTPEEAVAVLEDQLLELHVQLDALPRRKPLPVDVDADDLPSAPAPVAQPPPPAGRVNVDRLTVNLRPSGPERPRGFFSRLFASVFGR